LPILLGFIPDYEGSEMADKPLINVEHLTMALLSVTVVIDAVIKVNNMDRAAIGAAMRETKASLSAANRDGMLGQLIDHLLKVVELGPSKVPPPVFH
jgi:hypothetical protein